MTAPSAGPSNRSDSELSKTTMSQISFRTIAQRLVVVVAGIVLGQAVLYGPTLTGSKILLPLDLLAREDFYLPRTPEVASIVPHDVIMSDLVLQNELARRFAVSQLREGRLPLWCPHIFAGAPSLRLALSPPYLPGYFIRSPVVLAYIQMLVSMVAGLGAYAFFREVLKVEFWPAAIMSWCYPLTGAYIIWQGCGLPPVVCWLPWILLAVDKTVRQPSGWGGPMLAIVSGVVVVSGQLDVGGQVLLASGLYAVWCYFDQHGKAWFVRRSIASLAATVLAWTLGILSGAWLVVPMVEYAQTGSRVIRRSQGKEERPPVGLTALPQVVLPEAYGLTQKGSLYIARGNVPESAIGAYAGMIATLFLAPLAWCSPTHRTVNLFWAMLGFFALSWTLNVPGLVTLLRLPGLNFMSHNRFVFAASFSILALAAVGLDVLWRGNVSWQRGFEAPVIALAVICCWCLWRTAVLPEPIATQVGRAVMEGKVIGWIDDWADVLRLQHRYRERYALGAVLSALGFGGWILFHRRVRLPGWFASSVGILITAELLWFAMGKSAQCDPSLDYPRIAVLEQVANASPGRVIGIRCLPANLVLSHDLRDIRGYDGVDPARLMELMALAADKLSPKIPYALTQWFLPKMEFSPPNTLRLSPVLDMLGVRYAIFRGSPPPEIRPEFSGFDYWVLRNERALPRVFVPEQVETVEDGRERLKRLAAPKYDPSMVAYLEQPVSFESRCHGSASITEEIPTRVTVAAHMQTPGLVVLTDLWDQGWNAYLDGQRVPILRTNHAVRGVVVPAGQNTLEFRYEPASLSLGLKLSALSLLIWVAWAGALFRLRCRRHVQ